MKYCPKCDTEYEQGEQCMCSTYRKRMEKGQEWRVPQWWVTDWWEGPCQHTGWNHARKPSY